jgi:P4 family phage/plasmid primase-like protien
MEAEAKPGDPSDDVPTYYKGEMISRAEAARRREGNEVVPDIIPHQLFGCRFVLVRDKDKRAFETGWNDTKNYAHDSDRLQQHIKTETNYGVMVAGGLCVLDCDNVLGLYNDPFFSDVLMQTFAVKTGRAGTVGAHFYFKCPDLPAAKYSLVRDDGADLGDLRGSGSKFYVVGPGSTHPSGNQYKITNDVEPLTVPLVEVEAFIARYQTRPKAIVLPHNVSARGTIVDQLGLNVSDFLMPDEPRAREHQIEGIHPVHGSSTGSNLIIDPHENKWYCRRHSTGGGPLEALAVAEGIIQCEEVHGGCLHGHWPAVFDDLKKRGYGKQLAEMEREKQTKACTPRAPAINTQHGPSSAPIEEPQKKEIMPDSSGEEFAFTDAGNSDRLIHQHGENVRHCQTFSAWYTWTGKVWEKDVTNRMLDLSTRTARSILIESLYYGTDKAQACGKWALTSQSLARRNAMVDGATYQVAVKPDTWDKPEKLLNCQNGTLELDTLTFRKHHRDDLITKIMGVDYDPVAKCPQWEEHVKMVLADDDDLIRGFQEVCGYTLLAKNPEQVIFILYGTGKNGKNVTMDTLSYIMGDYATHIAAESLMVKRGESPRSDLARLVGSRMVTASEPAENAALAETVIKQLTGDARVTVRRLYENEFEFEPGGKIWLATNYQPRIVGTDEGIWRRIWLIPFTYTIPEKRRLLGYEAVLQAEGSGILNWCLEGYLSWMKKGKLVQPAAVKFATAQYRKEADTVAAWMAEKVMIDPGRQVSRKEVRSSYEVWCEDAGERPVSARKLAQELRARGIIDGSISMGTRAWSGLRWKSIEEQEGEL